MEWKEKFHSDDFFPVRRSFSVGGFVSLSFVATKERKDQKEANDHCMTNDIGLAIKGLRAYRGYSK